MRDGEQFTAELDEIANMFYGMFKERFRVILCCESPVKVKGHEQYPIQQMLNNGTKYLRLSLLLKQDKSDYFISIDNDICGNTEELEKFVKCALEEELDIAWGRIMANQCKGLFGGLVAVDKLLSHNILRPMLWKLKVGITIPGQCFWIKRNAFAGKLPEIDTFLDDLEVGLEVNRRQSDLKIWSSAGVLGYEIPNETFSGLWKQRSRWAKGYLSVLMGAKNLKDRNKVIIHGFAYHFLWIFSWLICFLLAYINPYWIVLYLGAVSFIIGRQKFLYAFLYQLIFPIFHIRWIAVILTEVMRGVKYQ